MHNFVGPPMAAIFIGMFVFMAVATIAGIVSDQLDSYDDYVGPIR